MKTKTKEELSAAQSSSVLISKPDVKFDYDSIRVGYYDQVFRRYKGAQSKWHHQKFTFVRERLGEYSNHLDIGCGPGTFLGMLDSEKVSVGVDISKPQVEYAKKAYGTATKTFQAIEPHQPLPFNNTQFDCVTLIELIEHLPLAETLVLLAQVRRVLKPGGRVILTTPNFGSLWPLIEKGVDAFSGLSYKDQHVEQFTRKYLRNVLTQAGFLGVKVGSFQWTAPFWAAINWKLSDAVNDFEHKTFGDHGGLLLIGEAKR
jgi:2-polyprenyl-3-methyl-5-hydroxy-6-metoxy-1,4-benzoquinol methylase